MAEATMSAGSRGPACWEWVGVLFAVSTLFATAAFAQRLNPYEAEGIAFDLGRTKSLAELETEARTRAKHASSSVDLGTVAELYKRLGNPDAAVFYERAIAADPSEPAWDLFLSQYFRLYRGAAKRPLFPQAARHLMATFRKLEALKADPSAEQEWDTTTLVRARRARAALYERDGFQLASATSANPKNPSAVAVPWLFLGLGGRAEQSLVDIDQSSDVRALTSVALLSMRRGYALSLADYRALAHTVNPREATVRLRARLGDAPVLDVSVTGRRTPNLQVDDFSHPTTFNDFELVDLTVGAEKPFTIGRATDVFARGVFHNARRTGLIERAPFATERVQQLDLSAAASRYLGPDRLNFSYSYAYQSILPEAATIASRDRRIAGGQLTYQIFRPLPLPRRDFNTGLGRRFETRGIEFTAGMLDDRERFPTLTADVFVTRRDYFVVFAAKGIGSFDFSVQPTWYSSQVSNDQFQNNAQVRVAGSLLMRVLDEERTPEMPFERFLGLPVAFAHLVVPFHWDVAREGPDTFTSRRVGAELWMKLLTSSGSGVAVLAVAGYSHQWFPAMSHRVHLFRGQLSVGF
jgi:hypothetical protein